MKKKFNATVLVFALMISVPVSGQGFLKKLKKATDKVTQAVPELMEAADKAIQVTPEQKTQEQDEPLYKRTNTKVETKVETFVTPHKTAATKEVAMRGIITDSRFSDGMLYFQIEGKSGYMNKEGDIVIEPKYKVNFIGNPRFDSGYAVVQREEAGTNRYFIIDHTGKETMLSKNVRSVSDFKNGKAIVCEYLTGKSMKPVCYFIDHTGKKILPGLLRSASCSDFEAPRGESEGLTAYYDVKAEKWGYYDALGKVAIAPTYEEAQDFSDGLAAVKTEDRKWHFIDKTGTVVITTEAKHEPKPFKDGIAIVENYDEWQVIIDKTGKQVTPEEFKNVSSFVDGYSLATDRDYHTGVLNSSYKFVKKFQSSIGEYSIQMPSKAGYNEAVFESGVAVIGNGQNYEEATSENVYRPDGSIAVGMGEEQIGRMGNFFDGLSKCTVRLARGEDAIDCFINLQGEIVFIMR